MASLEKRGHGKLNEFKYGEFKIKYLIYLERSASAEFRRIDRTVQINNATEVIISFKHINI
jgi:hypothetical protein